MVATDLLTAAVYLVARQDSTSGPTPDDAGDSSADAGTTACTSENYYDGRMGLRISAIFVILIGSLIGATFPVFAARHKGVHVPAWAFFIAKYFGSGVIVATAFIHLLAPANEALTNPCLTGVIVDYPWPEGIALIMTFVLFFVELMTMRYANFGDGPDHSHEMDTTSAVPGASRSSPYTDEEGSYKDVLNGTDPRRPSQSGHAPGVDHLGHRNDHVDAYDLERDPAVLPESYSVQMTAVFILEFGVIFHSIFIGLTLAVAGEEFVTLYIVLVFHQTFEGLGLGTRLADAPWPKDKRWTPYVLGVAYSLSTPISCAIGLGVRQTWAPGSATALIVNGVFDSISAGILIYTGLVELMAHEFMFSRHMQRAPIKVVLAAFGMMVLGAGVMALLGYWA